MTGGQAGRADPHALRPEPLGRLPTNARIRTCDRCGAGQRRARRPARRVHEAATAQIRHHGAPVRPSERMGHDAPLRQPQGHGAVFAGMAGPRHVGARAVVIEIAAEGGDNAAQAHGSNPICRKLAVPSRPTTRWSCTGMSNTLAASTTLRVMAMSACDGWGSPDG